MASVSKRGSSWYLYWRENGRQRKVSLGKITEKQAKDRLAEFAEDRITFRSWAAEYLNWFQSEHPSSYYRTEQIIRCHLLPRFGDSDILHISRQDVETYKHCRNVKASTVTKELRTLQAMLRLAVSWGKIPYNPIEGVKAPKDLDSSPPHWYTKEDLQKIYEVDPEYRWVWQFMANTGVRRGEALNLTRASVSSQELRIISTQYHRTKSGKWRAVPLSRGAREALTHLGDDYLLPRVNPRSLTRAFHRTVTRAGLSGSIHSLRHTYISHLVMAGIPLRTVQILAGHASYTTTEKYAHLSPDYLQLAGSQLDI